MLRPHLDHPGDCSCRDCRSVTTQERTEPNWGDDQPQPATLCSCGSYDCEHNDGLGVEEDFDGYRAGDIDPDEPWIAEE